MKKSFIETAELIELGKRYYYQRAKAKALHAKIRDKIDSALDVADGQLALMYD